MSKRLVPLSVANLDGLFNSKVRVKVLKYLFRNYPVNFGIQELAKIVQEPLGVVKQEVRALERIGLIKKYKF